MDPIVYEELEPVEVKVTHIVKGVPRNYILRSAGEKAAIKYKNCLSKSTVFGTDGKPSHVDGIHDGEPLLVSLCLFEQYGDPVRERPVPLATILEWNHQFVKKLFNKAKEISGLSDKKVMETEEDPNDESKSGTAGTPTSDSPVN